MKRTIVIAAMTLTLILTGCTISVPEKDNTADLQAEIDAMTQELQALQTELDSLKDATVPAEEVPVIAPPETAGISPSDPTPIPVAANENAPAKYSKSTADYDLESLANETAAAVSKAQSAERRSSREETFALFREIENELDSVDNKLDRCEDKAESDYRAGLLSRTDYREIEHRLEVMDEDLDRAEDILEYRLGIDD